jgi:2-dehydro-3-deoxyphosphogluconate aldolase/(4S)-4-hydroxy-2-oxoglutarate aldolase
LSAQVDRFLEELRRSRVIAILRGLDQSLAVPTADALHAGGVNLIEITTDSPGWRDALGQLVASAGRKDGAQIGTGTILTLEQAKQAVDAGAAFLVSPVFAADIADFARQRGVPYVPGALTPTEIHRAQLAGAACVKVFPAGTFGPDYIKRLLQPMSELRLVPTGGVTIETARRYLEAGAIGIAIGSDLLDTAGQRVGDLASTRARAERLLQSLAG